MCESYRLLGGTSKYGTMDVKDTTKDAVVSPVTADVPRDEAVLEAVEAEKSLGFVAAVRLYPKAIGWSVFFSLGVVMLAFGT